MKLKLSIKEYVLLASMLFGLFFGAGNLIFPPKLGMDAGSSIWPAVIGFCLTGVGLPLLGIIAMGISRSEGLLDMSSKVSKEFGYFFTCILYLSIGPLFAIPRTSTVSFSIGISPFVNEELMELSLLIFTFIFFLAVLLFSLKPTKILVWVGKVLNPTFLAFLAVLLVTALVSPMGNVAQLNPLNNYEKQSFFTGILEGYNTMDALASLAFGIIVINAIRQLDIKDPKIISICTMKSGVFVVLIMAIIYISLAFAGAQARTVYGADLDGGQILNLIATHYFNSFGGILLGIIITFACLKTSVGLVTASSTTFCELFPNLCSYRTYAIIFTLFSFGISNMGLSKIIEYSIPVLVFLYPLTICLIMLCIFGKTFKYQKCVFQWTIGLTVVGAFFDFIKNLPKDFKAHIPGTDVLEDLGGMLPLTDIGMSWIIPALIGLCIGLIFKFLGKLH